MKNSKLEEKYILNTAGGFLLIIIIGIVISAVRVNFYM